MTQREFVIVYVAVPLVVALVWLAWRARFFLRNAILYSLAVAALIGVLRLGHVAWALLDGRIAAATAARHPACVGSLAWPAGRPGHDGAALAGSADGSCWT